LLPATGSWTYHRAPVRLTGASSEEEKEVPVEKRSWIRTAVVTAAAVVSALVTGPSPVHADGDLNNVNHIIVMMQENHSFDNYFGVLAYVQGTPYHSAQGRGKRRACAPADNTCVDGLACKLRQGSLVCMNSNPSNERGRIRSFRDPRYCTGEDLTHGWEDSHRQGNFLSPNRMLKSSRNLGFVRVNAEANPVAQATDHDAMGYYSDADLPFYYDIAKTFAISDRYFCDVVGPTFPNRAYLIAGTSFGHLTTSEIVAFPGYKPITGTLYAQLDAAGVSWVDYYSDLPYSLIFSTSSGHTKPLSAFATDAANGTLPDVAFIDPSSFPDQLINGQMYQTDEHPPADIRAGEYFVSTVIQALRNSPSWNDSLLLLTYDEHGGFYDHVAPPPAPQGGADTPDGIAPGQCADLSNPPASLAPGGGVNCNTSKTSSAPGLCPAFTPTGPYPADCATFNQLGFRVPFFAVSPFAKPNYVSHTVASHASILALIQKRFSLANLTARDANASTLEDMFDFDGAPSLNAPVGTAPLPMQPGDHNCPFGGSPSGAFLEG
jgi:phospholipase C